MSGEYDAEEDNDILTVTPLGAGQEVGRSCILIRFKGKQIILDCGIHPGLKSSACLPFIDQIENIERTDLVLISHFHLDHCGGLPHLLLKTECKAKCYMTHATKAIYRWMLADYIRVSSSAQVSETPIFAENDIKTSMEKIDTLDFHQEIVVNGIKFTAFHAGHVLGAAMFMIEIAGVKVLYTGDFSRQEDRHLMSAEVPSSKPDMLICESTYGTHIHDVREERETRFTNLVYDVVVRRGGRCLIPAFALGRAQELMLILEDYWSQHPELHRIPVYYCSQLAKKCLTVYQTYIHAMNSKIRRRLNQGNPFVFKYISNLKSIDHFNDLGPCVVMASPGMLQSGLSRELFEHWCTDRRNAVIIAGYCVEGTLAKMILSSPSEIPTMNGQMLPLKCQVEYISFSAHTDYQQTSEFIRLLKPNHTVLVHGEANEALRLKNALLREYEDDESYKIDIHLPKNCETVNFHFCGEKMAKIVGELAMKAPVVGGRLSGVLIKKNFSYHILTPSELPKYTDLATSEVTQKISIGFKQSASVLSYNLTLLAGDVEEITKDAKTVDAAHKSVRSETQDLVASKNVEEQGRVFCVFGSIFVTWTPIMVIIEWKSNPINDMFANSVQTLVLRTQMKSHINDQNVDHEDLNRLDSESFPDVLLSAFKQMFGEECVRDACGRKASGATKRSSEEYDIYAGPGKRARVELNTMTVRDCNDKKFELLLKTTMQRMYYSLIPVKRNLAFSVKQLC